MRWLSTALCHDPVPASWRAFAGLNNKANVWTNFSTNLTLASTGSPCSSFDLLFPLQWGWLCLSHSDTSCGSSALMDTLKLITISVKTHVGHSDLTSMVVRAMFLTFSVCTLYLQSHFFSAVHPGQSHFFGRWHLVCVFCETVHVLRAPCKASSPTYNCPLGCLFLSGVWVYHRMGYFAAMHADNIFFSMFLTAGQTGGLFFKVESLVLISWAS